MIAALAIARRFWPVAAVLAVLLALWLWGNSRHEAGMLAERREWQKVVAKVRDQAAELARTRQSAKDAAEVAATERARLYGLLRKPIQIEVETYGKSPAGAVRCLDSVGVRIGADAIAAANRSTAAAR